MPRDLFFSEPFRAVWLLIIPLVLGLLFYGYRKRNGLLAQLTGDVGQTIYSRSWVYSSIKGMLIAAAIALAVTALMAPQGNAHRQAAWGKSPLDLYLLIDRSYSMDVKDAKNNLSRLERAKQIADRLMDDLNGEAVALYGFTDHAELLVPLTYDIYFARLILRDLNTTAGGRYGTDLEGVVKQVGEDLASKPYGNPSMMLILSDGEDTKWEGEGSRPLTALGLGKTTVAAVMIGSAAGGVIPGIDVQGKQVESKAMKERLAAFTNGQVFEDTSDLTDKLLAVIEKADQTALLEQSKEVVYDDYFQYPLFAAMVCFLLAWMLPLNRLWVLLLCIVPVDGEIWLQDRMDYNESILRLQAGNGMGAEEILMAISPQAYSSPIFRSRIAINYAEAGLKGANDPLQVQNGLLVLRLMQLLPCDPLNLCQPDLQNGLLNALQNVLAEKQEPLYSQKAEIEEVKKLMEAPDFPESLKASYQDYLQRLSKDGGALNILPLIHFAALMPSPEVIDRVRILLANNGENGSLEKGRESADLMRLEVKWIAAHSPLTPYEAIRDLVDSSTVVSFLQLIGGEKAERQEMLALYEERMAQLYKFQQRAFRLGQCQCAPWNEVMPLLTLGGGYLKQSAAAESQELRYGFLNAAQSSFRKALGKLKDAQAQGQADRQVEQELQEMQQLDRPAAQERKPGDFEGGKPW